MFLVFFLNSLKTEKKKQSGIWGCATIKLNKSLSEEEQRADIEMTEIGKQNDREVWRDGKADGKVNTVITVMIAWAGSVN